MLIASTFLLWIVVAVLVVAVLALARQLGTLRERLAPTVADAGPQAGDPAPAVHATALDGSIVVLGPLQPAQRPTLLLFIGDGPACRTIAPLAWSVAATRNLDLVLIGEGDDDAMRAMVDRCRLGGLPLVNSAAIGVAFGVGRRPCGVLVGSDGFIVARGFIQSRAQLDSLLAGAPAGQMPPAETAKRPRPAPA